MTNSKLQSYKFQHLRACLVINFKLTFLHFKQHYTHFYTLFYLHIFEKITNNNSQTTLPNTPSKVQNYNNTTQRTMFPTIFTMVTTQAYIMMNNLSNQVLYFFVRCFTKKEISSS